MFRFFRTSECVYSYRVCYRAKICADFLFCWYLFVFTTSFEQYFHLSTYNLCLTHKLKKSLQKKIFVGKLIQETRRVIFHFNRMFTYRRKLIILLNVILSTSANLCWISRLHDSSCDNLLYHDPTNSAWKISCGVIFNFCDWMFSNSEQVFLPMWVRFSRFILTTTN